jgi:hypothetical protein
MAKKAASKNIQAAAAASDILTMSLSDLEQRVTEAKALFQQIEGLLPGLVELTALDRRHSSGRFREGEAQVLETVLDLADERPALFQTLANSDHGDDPNTFEVAALRGRLRRAQLLSSLLTDAESAMEGISDTVLYLGDRTRPVLLAAYEIAKPHARHDTAIRTSLARLIDFYSRLVRVNRRPRAAATQSEPGTPPR